LVGAERRGAASSWQRARTEAPQTSKEVYRHVWSGARVVSGTNGAGKMQDARRKTQDARHLEYYVTPSLADVQRSAAAAAVEMTESAVAWDRPA
jgi:hypothetical protein